MIEFPDIPVSRIAVKVKPAAERMIRKEHPWIFESAIVKQSKEAAAGDLVIIYDQKKNKVMALGLYDPFSPIRVKLLHFRTAAQINEQWFANRIQAAFDLRKPLLETDTDSYRFIHGENDHLPGLIADVYAQVLVLKLYSFIWLPYLSQIVPPLVAVSGVDAVVLRLSRNLQQQPQHLHGLEEGQIIHGQLDNPEVIFKEHGLRFSANVIHGHKTGYFLDHRHNRKRVGELAEGQRVLDVFAYAGGFSVHALCGNAKEVTSLDISAQALEMAKKNVALNLATAKHKTIAGDAFEVMEQLIRQHKRYDLIVVDPPSFAKSEKEIPSAISSYTRLARLAVQLVAPNGILLMASCSSRITEEVFFQTIVQELRQSKRSFQEIERHTHDIDHPIGFPEGAYLKAGYFRIT
ncbi:MAG: class I SAM-dependent rRNA methyltransferase [Saprospiraceae bacterium]|nr:class I SAM-dependent rRNA methyltransferase [Saprospiraceae bacterium]